MTMTIYSVVVCGAARLRYDDKVNKAKVICKKAELPFSFVIAR